MVDGPEVGGMGGWVWVGCGLKRVVGFGGFGFGVADEI